MTGWRDLLPGVPDELTTKIALAAAPAAPFIPLEWQGKKVASVVACWRAIQPKVESSSDRCGHSGRQSQTYWPGSLCESAAAFRPRVAGGAANYFTSAFFIGCRTRPSIPSSTISGRPLTCRCVPSCTFITSAERLREFRSALPPLPTAPRTLCSSASRVHLAEPTFQNISTGACRARCLGNLRKRRNVCELSRRC